MSEKEIFGSVVLPETVALLTYIRKQLYLGNFAQIESKISKHLDSQTLPPEDRIILLLRQGKLLRYMIRYSDCERIYWDAIELSKKCESPLWEYYIRVSQADLFLYQFNYKPGLDILENILVQKESEQIEISPFSIYVLAKVHEYLSFLSIEWARVGDKSEIEFKDLLYRASIFSNRALKAFKEINWDIGIATQWLSLGRIRFNLALIRRGYLNLEQHNEGVLLTKKALNIFHTIGDKIGEGVALNNLGWSHSHKFECKDAVALIETAALISETVSDTWFLARQEESLGQIYGDCLKNLEKAISWYQKSINSHEKIKAQIIGESEHHEKYFEEISYVYQRYVEFLALDYLGNSTSKVTLEDIFNAIELSKAHVLLKRLQGSSKLYLQDEESISLNTRALEKDLSIQHHSSLEEIQQYIQDDELILSFYSTLKSMYCLVIKSEKVAFVRLCSVDAYRNLYYDYRKHLKTWLGRDDVDLFNSFQRKISELLVQKLPVIWERYRKIILVPEAEFGFLSFSSIPLLNKKLGLTHIISQQASVNIWLRVSQVCKNHPTRNKPATNFFLKNSFNTQNDLPEEANLGEYLEKHSEIKGLKESDLTKVNLKKLLSQESDLVIFYTHAQAGSEDRWEEPYIVISDEKGDDYHLKASEIFNMNISTKLVVLAACSSGSGELRYGEGLMSLARSFLGAGVQCVLCPLWEVWGKTTINFIEYFLEQIIEKQVNIDQALYTTRNTFNKQTSILNWGAFILVGNANFTLTNSKKS